MVLPWYCCLAVALACGPVRSQDPPALTPENEVPLRPTLWLTEGKVTPIPLPKDRTRRLYFTLKRRNSLMSLTVSPCDVPIEWSLTARTLKDKPSKSLHWSTKKSMPEMWWRGSGTETKLHSFTGNRIEVYTGRAHALASIYILQLKSREQNTKASVYLQEGDGTPGPFPELPLDPRVHTLGVGMTSVTLSWMPSPSIQKLPPSSYSYQYCVLVNDKQNFGSLCAVQEAMKRGRKRERKPKVTVWPILKEWWWQQWDTLKEAGGSPLSPLNDPRELQCICRGTESVCTVSELTPDTQHYFDVFVMDTLNGTSLAYTGTHARTHEEARPVITPLGEGELRWVPLRVSGQQGDQFFSFRPRGWQQSALLTLQSCSAQKVKVTVSNARQVLVSQPVGEELAQIWLEGKPSYLIHLEDMRSTQAPVRAPKSTVKMQVSSAYHRQAAPVLPATLQMKSFNKLRSCNSVTLAWLGTEERSLYCLYKRRLGEGEQANAKQCLGPESRSETERVLCKYFQELNPRRAVTTATVGGLEPGTAYLFDIYLMRRWGIPVKYHSKTVRTRKEC